MRFYHYISDSKLEMLFPQIPPKFLGGLKVELGFDFGLLKGKLAGENTSPAGRIAQDQAVERYLEEKSQIVETAEQHVWLRGSFSARIGFLTDCPGAIVNWNSFSIGGNEVVRINQPGATSVILNRVTGNDPSSIYGQISANGKVFLVNPSGVLFGEGARVDVGSLVASTLSIGNADFLAGRYTFSGSGGSLVNRGAITAAQHGTVALLGGSVGNQRRNDHGAPGHSRHGCGATNHTGSCG